MRLRQCLVEYNAPNNESRRPLFNALKYASSFPVIFLSAAQRIVVSDTLALKGESAASQPWHGEHQLFRLWCVPLPLTPHSSLLTRAAAHTHSCTRTRTPGRLLAAAVNSLYSFWWDVTNDWGLDLLLPSRARARGLHRQSLPPRPLLLPRLHSRSALLKHPARSSLDSLPEEDAAYALPPERPPHAHTHQHPWGLRPVLLFPLAVYPFAILVDLVLRLTWSAKLSSHLHAYAEGDLIIFWIELAEVVRRWMWVFLRVEWEAVKEAQMHDRDGDAVSRSPPRSAEGVGLDAGAGGIAMERREAFREPILEQEDFEMVPSDISGRNSDAG